MELKIDPNLKEFSKNNSAFLESETLMHSFILGIVGRYLEIDKSMHRLVSLVDAKGAKVAAAIQTENDKALIISKCSEAHARALANHLFEKGDKFPAVNGPVPAVDAFSNTWAELQKKSQKLCTNLRLFCLDELIPPNNPKGFARVASPQDREVIFSWLRAFQLEAVPHDPKPSDEDLYKSVDNGTKAGQFFIWEQDSKAVCLVGARRETATEKWIAPVYTPPECRGMGYGTALTAFVSRRILDTGKKGMLFTDLANPTSNSIYQKIGYRAIADFKHIEFISPKS